MKKFQFSLETLLQVRTQRIKIFAGELFETAKECQMLSTNEHLLKEEIRGILREIKKSREEGDFKKQTLYNAYLDRRLSEKEELQRGKERKQKELLMMQQKTSKAIVERKIVEKLKEKRYSVWENKIRKEDSWLTYRKADQSL